MSDHIKSKLEERFRRCLCTTCEKRRCKLGLDSLPPDSLTIIDADKLKREFECKGQICDFIVFYWPQGTKVAIVELKSGLVKQGDATNQMTNGARIAAKIIGSKQANDFFPILLHGKRLTRLQIDMLKRVKVRFQSKDYMVIIDRCGEQLKDIFRKYERF